MSVRRFATVAAMLTLAAAPLAAQDGPHKFGLVFYTCCAANVGFEYEMAPRLTLRPQFGFDRTESAGGVKTTTLDFGADLLFERSAATSPVRTYIGAGIGVERTSVSGGGSGSDLFINGLYGARVRLATQLSLFGEVALTWMDFDAGGNSLSLGNSSIGAIIYLR